MSETKKKIKKCNHNWTYLHSSMGDERKPTSRRCSKCGTQEFF